jgi:hypothetical protein
MRSRCERFRHELKIWIGIAKANPIKYWDRADMSKVVIDMSESRYSSSYTFTRDELLETIYLRVILHSYIQ